MCALRVKVRVRELTRSTIKIIIKLLLISRNFFFFFRFWRCFRLHEARLINFLRRRAQLFQKGVFKTRDSLTNWGFGRRVISLARSRAERDSWIVAAWESLRSELCFFQSPSRRRKDAIIPHCFGFSSVASCDREMFVHSSNFGRKASSQGK